MPDKKGVYILYRSSIDAYPVGSYDPPILDSRVLLRALENKKAGEGNQIPQKTIEEKLKETS